MAVHGWQDVEHSNHPAQAAALLRGAVRGEPIAWLLEEAARNLRETAGADRAAVWLLTNEEPRILEGTVVQAGGEVASERWMKLDPTQPELSELLGCPEAEVLLSGAESVRMRFGPLAGAAKALWLPLRIEDESLGLALVAWRNESAVVDSSQLRALADALALAVSARNVRPFRHASAKFTGATDSPLDRALEAEAQLSSVVESADAGIGLFDCHGNVRLLNGRLAQLLGFPRHALAEVRTWDSLALLVAEHFNDYAKFLDRWGEIALRPAEVSWDELELDRPAPRTIERFVRPVLGPSGELLGRLEVYRDVTSLHMVQDDFLQTEKMAGLGQLVSGIAHELKNPLTSIIGYSQLLLGRRLTPPQIADARLIYQEAERAARIVKNLLLFARETRPERRAVNLNEIVERTLALRDYELRMENIDLVRDLGQDLPLVVADASQMQQVLLNLIVNAEQAIRQGTGEGSIRVRTRQTADGRVSFEISDSGPGIPAEIIPRIFDPFFSTKPVGAGTGLGLSITFSIIQEHGGEISVESLPGRGAKFTIELPVATGAAAFPAPMAVKGGGVPAARRAARCDRVLIVEDEPSVAHLIADVLSEEGHPVEIVLDGRDGLARALTGQYDLIILDLRMPHLDGRAIHRELVAKGSPLQHRVVFVTGDTLTPRTMEFLETSGRPFLAKPFLVEELKDVVARALAAADHAPVAEASGYVRPLVSRGAIWE